MIIRLDAAHISRTYGGCLEGPPDVETTVESMKVDASLMWGSHTPVLVLPYTAKTVGTRPDGTAVKMLPEWCIQALLLGPRLTEEDDGSHLIVVWFTNEPNFEIEPLLDQFKWEDHAEGFGY